MKFDQNDLENLLFEYAEQIRLLISPELWGNALINCSKNEIFILMLLYRSADVNMTQIADYINVPLNTATGIIARMEQRHMVNRERSNTDKRVVTIALTGDGKKQLDDILKEFIYYGQKILGSFTKEEAGLIGSIFDKILKVLREERLQDLKEPVKKLKKIRIE